MIKPKFLLHLLQRFPENVRGAISTGLLGLAAGLSAVAFLFLTNFLFTQTYLLFAEKSVTFFIIASFIVISASSLLVGYLLNVFSPEAAGSGIPQIKTAYWKELGYVNFKPVLVKFVAGVLSIGGGNSLGREGPSVFIGSGAASNLDGILGTPPRQRRSATLIGAAAGLAAAFNTPLAAITFVIEEIIGDMNNRYLGRVVLSSVIGAFSVYAILGRHPAFSLPSVENISWFHYLIVPFVSIFGSLAGVAFQKGTIFIRGRLIKQKQIPRWLLPFFGGIITWIIGCTVFYATGKIGVFGLGYQDLSNALNNNMAWEIAGILVGAKLLATIAGYSFGGCGGIFAPSLFIGGLTGYFIGGLSGYWVPLTPADHIVLAAVGMSACLGAIVHAPLTSMLIVFEMTHQFSLVPGLMIGTIISQAVAHRFSKLNFYDALLVQDGHELHKIRPPLDLQSWQNLPISAIASPKPVGLHDLTIDEMQKVIDAYPYSAFPVFSGEIVKGVITRQQIEQALYTKKIPRIQKMGVCYADQTVKEVGNKFVESAAHVLIVLERGTDGINGIVTLHDLIRAQAAIQT
ncbi:MAG TPA: chloride channel protein [Spirochaetota bacterium]|nr:chloride channel protein [Spirochaetota bacterium]HQF10615.1 chloride channel protein [Spirochaetota bacterium]HQH99594.1 chloride channel protein [Spirochaetota bacterium]HQJ73178.1 chloride channel protein [Spirochaetota bacterium]